MTDEGNTPDWLRNAGAIKTGVQALRRMFGDEALAEEMARQADDPGILVAKLTGEPIWGVRYEVCLSYADRRDVLRTLGQIQRVSGLTIMAKKYWPCRLVISVMGDPLHVSQVFAALDARTKRQVFARVPVRKA